MSRGFAVAVGAFVGALLGLEASSSIVTTIPFFLVGGALAYIGADPKGFANGLKRALRESGERVYTRWPDKEHWKDAKQALFGTSGAMLAMGLMVARGVLVMTPLIMLFGVEMSLMAVAVRILTGFIMVLALGLFFVPSITLVALLTARLGENEELLLMFRKFSRDSRPIVFEYKAYKWLGESAGPRIKLVARSAWWFAQDLALLTFAYTHTAKRRVCFIDAVVCSALGYAVGNPLIGAGVGWVVGTIHYPLTKGLAERWHAYFEEEFARSRLESIETE